MQEAWDAIEKFYPDIIANSSLKNLVWETPDPENWVPDGYIIIRVDARGCGKSPGRLAPNSPEEFRDFYDAIEWAGVQPWCNGKVGLTGISYHAAGQWRVASLKPPHLFALCPWMGTYDFFRDRTRQDGIYGSGFISRWWARSVLRNQHGNGESPYHDLYTGGKTTGDVALTPNSSPPTAPIIPARSSLIRSTTASIRTARPISRRSTRRSSWSPIGAGSRSICAAPSAAISASPHPRNG